jgi:hypothetical protein
VCKSINKCKQLVRTVKYTEFTVALKIQITGCVREYFERETSKMAADLAKCGCDLCPLQGNT